MARAELAEGLLGLDLRDPGAARAAAVNQGLVGAGLEVSEVRTARRPLREVLLELTSGRTGGADSLRKWPAAWGLLLVTPVLVLLSDYVAQFISYLNLTPADYATYGTPARNLPALLPGQFNIIAVNQFNFSGTAPFIVLGAVMAGGDWGRGTITTALLQKPGRAKTFAGQPSRWQ